MKIGIIGNGFVGKATTIFECSDIDIIIYDINPELCKPIGTKLTDIIKTDIIFISVPTPMNVDGSCHIDILKSVINDIRKLDIDDNLLLVNRCTVPIGTSNSLNCYYMPEFLTEKNFKNDFVNNQNWIFGLKKIDKDLLFKKKITELISISYKNNCIKYNNINFVENNEAEMIKLFRNNFLATKVSFCNEFYQFCKSVNVNYENVRKLAVLDNRILSSHSNVPGPDGKFGYGGTCFPKDSNSLLHQMKKNNIDSYIIKATVERNENVDRKEKDWQQDKGRAFII